VSIVFELLGAAVVTTALMISESPEFAGTSILDVINIQKAVEIIIGIFVSIAVAFSLGGLVQWFCRLLFTFRFKKRLKRYGAIFGGVAISIIIYFLLIKGLKGAAFVTDDFAKSVEENALVIMLVTLLAASLLCLIL